MSIFTAYSSVDSPQQWMNILGGNTNSVPGTGTTVYDVSGNNLNGTLLSGVTYNSSNGGYLTFDGVNDWCNFQIASKPLGTLYDQTSFSFGGWFMFPTSGTTTIVLLGKGGPNTNSWGWSLQIDKINGTQFQANMVTCSSPNSFTGQAGFSSTLTNPNGAGTILANTWYFVFGTLDWGNAQGNSAGTRSLRCYVANNSTGVISVGTAGTSTGAWLRGSNTYGWTLGISMIDSPSTTWYNYSVGNIEVYTGIALSIQQIGQIFNKNKALYGY